MSPNPCASPSMALELRARTLRFLIYCRGLYGLPSCRIEDAEAETERDGANPDEVGDSEAGLAEVSVSGLSRVCGFSGGTNCKSRRY